jgi:hypothetical protein
MPYTLTETYKEAADRLSGFKTRGRDFEREEIDRAKPVKVLIPVKQKKESLPPSPKFNYVSNGIPAIDLETIPLTMELLNCICDGDVFGKDRSRCLELEIEYSRRRKIWLEKQNNK